MKTSEQLNELAGALAKAQIEMGNAAFNKVNPHFKNKYADLAAIRDAVVPILAKHNIAVIQPPVMGDGVLIVTTRLMHSSGQWIESEYPIINDTGKPQAMGSALTYARRYSLAAICGIASEEDDDGEAAQAHGKDKAGPHSPDKQITRDPNADTANINGTAGAPKRLARNEYERLVNELRMCSTPDACKEWLKLRKLEIDKLPEDWVSHLDEEYGKHKDSLTARAA